MNNACDPSKTKWLAQTTDVKETLNSCVRVLVSSWSLQSCVDTRTIVLVLYRRALLSSAFGTKYQQPTMTPKSNINAKSLLINLPPKLRGLFSKRRVTRGQSLTLFALKKKNGSCSRLEPRKAKDGSHRRTMHVVPVFIVEMQTCQRIKNVFARSFWRIISR